jgi:hypothetical protein
MKDCSNCGEEIPEKRVKAMPNTELCVFCQEKLEKAGKFQRHVMDVQPVMKAGEVDEINSTIVRAN